MEGINQEEKYLKVLGASYGLKVVTKECNSRIKDHKELLTAANDDQFGDSWYGNVKNLVVCYQYGNEQPITTSVPQRPFDKNSLSIKYSDVKQKQFHFKMQPKELNILGAVYGPTNVTEKIQNLVKDNTLSIVADDNLLGNEVFNVEKTLKAEKSLTIVYSYGLNYPITKVVKQGQKMEIKKVFRNTVQQIEPRGIIDNDYLINFQGLLGTYFKVENNKVLAVDRTNTPMKFVVKNYCQKTRKFQLAIPSEKKGSGPTQWLGINEDNQLVVCDQGIFFYLFLTTKGNVSIFAVDKGYLSVDKDRSVFVDKNISFQNASSLFNLTIDHAKMKELQPKIDSSNNSDVLNGANDCLQEEMNYLYTVTVGFFLAIGIGPGMISGEETLKPGLWNIVKEIKPVMDALEVLQEEKTITAALLFGFMHTLYQHGLLWKITWTILKSVGWFAAAKLVAKILEWIFAPELETVEVTASIIIWICQVGVAADNWGKCVAKHNKPKN